MRPPDGAQIFAPEFPPKMEWLNVPFLRMVGMLDRRAVMVEFFDTARVNSHRTLPYIQGWLARYADRGLRVVGVHTPAYSFGRDRDTVGRAARAMGVDHPVLLDTAGATASVQWHGGGAWAVLSGTVEPGLYESAGIAVADRPGLRLHGFQFTPAAPTASPRPGPS